MPFVQLQGNTAFASPKEQLYEQITSNPAFTERNIQKANAYLLDSRPEQKSLVTYRTLTSLYVCVWFVNTLTSTAPIGADYLRQSACDLQLIFTNNRKGIYLSVQKTLVGQELPRTQTSLSRWKCARKGRREVDNRRDYRLYPSHRPLRFITSRSPLPCEKRSA